MKNDLIYSKNFGLSTAMFQKIVIFFSITIFIDKNGDIRQNGQRLSQTNQWKITDHIMVKIQNYEEPVKLVVFLMTIFFRN